MRLFLAIELPQDTRSHLLEVRNRLEQALPKISYTRGENLHLTLKFLGEVEPKRVAEITESLSKIKSPRIELAATQLDCFPSRGPIRIVTAALDGALPPLRGLVESIEQRCHFLGFAKEQRAYRPHVTLARARPVLSAKFRVAAAEGTGDLWPGPTFTPAEFVLMESQLSPKGSKYSAVARFPHRLKIFCIAPGNTADVRVNYDLTLDRDGMVTSVESSSWRRYNGVRRL